MIKIGKLIKDGGSYHDIQLFKEWRDLDFQQDKIDPCILLAYRGEKFLGCVYLRDGDIELIPFDSEEEMRSWGTKESDDRPTKELIINWV